MPSELTFITPPILPPTENTPHMPQKLVSTNLRKYSPHLRKYSPCPVERTLHTLWKAVFTDTQKVVSSTCLTKSPHKLRKYSPHMLKKYSPHAQKVVSIHLRKDSPHSGSQAPGDLITGVW